MSSALASSSAHEVAPADLDHRFLPVALIDVGARNPRKHYDQQKLDELRESILRVGVVQPIIVRPIGERYELVAGERRLRATRAALLPHIPAVVKELSDKDAFDIQLTENAQRQDLHPLEEAEGFATALREFGYDVDALALKIGKSRSYVYGRMKLADLCDEVKAKCYDGTLPHSHALLIARIPDQELQKKALEVAITKWNGEPVSYRTLKAEIGHKFEMRLTGAQFDPADTTLVPERGACLTCPLRSGNQAALFDDVDDADVCTLPPCFHAKEEVTWQRSQEKQAKKGFTVLSLAKGKQIAPWGYVQGGGYYDLEKPHPDTPRGEPLKKLLPKDAKVAIVRDGYGKTHKVIAKKDLAAAGVEIAKPKQRTSGVVGGQHYDHVLDQKIARSIAAAISAAVELALNPDIELTILRAEAEGLVRGDVETQSLTREQCLGVIAGELLRDQEVFLALIGVDVEAIEKNVTREHMAEKETPQSKAKKKKGKVATEGVVYAKGTCRVCGCTETTPCTTDTGPCGWTTDDQTICSACDGEFS